MSLSEIKVTNDSKVSGIARECYVAFLFFLVSRPGPDTSWGSGRDSDDFFVAVNGELWRVSS